LRSQPIGAAATNQFVRPAAISGTPRGVLPIAKPFQPAFQRPTVSPYLNLYREELDDSLPNYFAFVLPQLRQEEFAYQQQMELARLQQQLQARGAAGLPAPPVETAQSQDPHNYRARFMNTGHYFSGVPLPQPAVSGPAE
jgi:hypothetical protein